MGASAVTSIRVCLLCSAVLGAWAAAPGAASEVAREAGPAARASEPEGLASVWGRETLTGDWGGLRPQLGARGVTFGLTSVSDGIGIVSGGLDRGAESLNEWDLTLTVDTGPLFGWRGGTLFLYGLGLWQTGSPSEQAGDVQALDHIDAPNQWRLYEAWYEQQLFEDRLSLLAGLYDVSGEFDVTEGGQLFLNSSFGTGKDLSQSGVKGPSIFPSTSLGVRVGAKPLPNTYARFAVLDGVPGDPDSDTDQRFFSMDREQGVLCIGEVGYAAGGDEGAPATKVGLGGWFYSADFDPVRGVDPGGEASRSHGNYGLYVLGERVVHLHPRVPGRALSLFARAGFADADVNPVGVYVGGGAVVTGGLRSRPNDQLGLGVAAAIAGHQFERAAEAAGTPVDGAEVAIELTYRAQLAPWLHVQPDVQYIVNPGLGGIDDALAIGARVEIDY